MRPCTDMLAHSGDPAMARDNDIVAECDDRIIAAFGSGVLRHKDEGARAVADSKKRARESGKATVRVRHGQGRSGARGRRVSSPPWTTSWTISVQRRERIGPARRKRRLKAEPVDGTRKHRGPTRRLADLPLQRPGWAEGGRGMRGRKFRARGITRRRDTAEFRFRSWVPLFGFRFWVPAVRVPLLDPEPPFVPDRSTRTTNDYAPSSAKKQYLRQLIWRRRPGR